ACRCKQSCDRRFWGREVVFPLEPGKKSRGEGVPREILHSADCGGSLSPFDSRTRSGLRLNPAQGAEAAVQDEGLVGQLFMGHAAWESLRVSHYLAVSGRILARYSEGLDTGPPVVSHSIPSWKRSCSFAAFAKIIEHS